MDDPNCVFCQIVAGRLPADILLQDQDLTVFRDHRPVASVHILVVPNKHIGSLNNLEPSDNDLIVKLINTARDVAHKVGIHKSGYRIVINTGPNAGQSVFHLHVHLLGGERLSFPMKFL